MKEYSKPEITIIRFEIKNVVTTSFVNIDGGSVGFQGSWLNTDIDGGNTNFSDSWIEP